MERSGSVHVNPTVDEPLDGLDSARQRGVLEQPGSERGAPDDFRYLHDDTKAVTPTSGLGNSLRLAAVATPKVPSLPMKTCLRS